MEKDSIALRFVEGWEAVAAGLLQRVRREAVGHVLDAKTAGLLQELEQYPGVQELRVVQTDQGPVLPMTFVLGEKRFSYFSLVSTVGTLGSIAAQELRVECMFRRRRSEPQAPSAKAPMRSGKGVDFSGWAAFD